MRVVLDEGGLAAVAARVTADIARITEQVAADARAYAPVRTGELRESITASMDGDTGVVRAGAPYALYVEDGHRIVAWGHETGRFQPPRPFLRPALYQRRSM